MVARTEVGRAKLSVNRGKLQAVFGSGQLLMVP